MKDSTYGLVVRIVRECAGYTSYAKVDERACSTRYLADIESGKCRPGPSIAAELGLVFRSRRLLKVSCNDCPVKDAMHKISCVNVKSRPTAV